MRYFLELAYFGKAYHGWQRQPNALSVQEVVENALFTLFQNPIEVVGAGRTDAGVHARQIFAHFEVEDELQGEFLFRLNCLLPKDVAAKAVKKVTAEAHARFSAVSRSYEYHMVQEKDVFETETAFLVQRELNVQKMNEAAQILLKYKDFKCFSRSRTDVHTYNCELKSARWEVKGKKLIFHITSDRFLRNMVRAIVGTLVEIGLGKMEVEHIHRVVRSGSRSEAGASVPAHGLFLTAVEYPKEIFI